MSHDESNGSHRHDQSTDRVELVAHQTDDGAYEIRVERHGHPERQGTERTGDRTTDRASERTTERTTERGPVTRMSAGTPVSGAPSAGRSAKRRSAFALVAGVVAAAGLGAGVAIVREPARPQIVEPEPVESFRAYRLDPRPTLERAFIVETGSPDEPAAEVAPDAGVTLDAAVTTGEAVVGEATLVPAEVVPAAVVEIPALDPQVAQRLEAVPVAEHAVDPLPDDEEGEGDGIEPEELDDEELPDEELPDDEALDDEALAPE
ncbi:MAG: hypothetical protein H6697_06150 [Myxococcales bacterium]|nr:hypothetical protein [Myxococcales bacterium]MCB9520971.1 hypothetical protein [Myxococcales bacterium]